MLVVIVRVGLYQISKAVYEGTKAGIEAIQYIRQGRGKEN